MTFVIFICLSLFLRRIVEEFKFLSHINAKLHRIQLVIFKKFHQTRKKNNCNQIVYKKNLRKMSQNELKQQQFINFKKGIINSLGKY